MKNAVHSDNLKPGTRGFTLIEVMVSMAIFVIVMVIAMSAFLSVLAVNVREQNGRQVIDSLSYALEDIQREAWYGHDFSCGEEIDPISGTCTSDSFSLISTTGGVEKEVTYRLHDGVLQKSDEDGNFPFLTPYAVEFDNVTFTVSGGASGDSEPALVMVNLSARVGDNAKETSEYHLQTSITQRGFSGS